MTGFPGKTAPFSHQPYLLKWKSVSTGSLLSGYPDNLSGSTDGVSGSTDGVSGSGDGIGGSR